MVRNQDSCRRVGRNEEEGDQRQRVRDRRTHAVGDKDNMPGKASGCKPSLKREPSRTIQRTGSQTHLSAKWGLSPGNKEREKSLSRRG